ncbi:hypothetical protein QT381_01950 [Galbitalea sp. SE-J8]|uniref:putative acetyltransferase n=1 Tax=Galbitalea sp. SE-J8 TaxID=3054952 RepID=UPI00259D0E2F|nr:hypothetical protein [Galbitalea sp. SE-J8]MDM4761766.1 hypothetical protein [Galbitalea sp. SE-J8]
MALAADAVALLRAAPDGTRVSVRRLLPDGSATDAVGYLSGASDSACVVATVRGLVTIAFDTVVAAREVPPPPPRRVPAR